VAEDQPSDLTRLMEAVRAGAPGAADRLFPIVYAELRSMAAGLLNRERAGHTLQPTALVHEAYLKLIDRQLATVSDRAHFFAIAATIMRRLLVDHARARRAQKRGGEAQRVLLDEVVDGLEEQSADLVDLDAVVEQLAALDPLKARLVELRFFGGLTVEETAEVLGLTVRSLEREWAAARAWLRTALNGGFED
jgi:RNA polymerase sigma factor (TIGR02999 family)